MPQLIFQYFYIGFGGVIPLGTSRRDALTQVIGVRMTPNDGEGDVQAPSQIAELLTLRWLQKSCIQND